MTNSESSFDEEPTFYTGEDKLKAPDDLLSSAKKAGIELNSYGDADKWYDAVSGDIQNYLDSASNPQEWEDRLEAVADKISQDTGQTHEDLDTIMLGLLKELLKTQRFSKEKAV